YAVGGGVGGTAHTWTGLAPRVETGVMALRLAGYLAFLWANAALGWTFLRESAAGGTPLSAFFRAWWLLLLSALTTLSLVTLTTKDPGNVRKSTAQAGSSPS
ncbi:unnamed protein product, partial [Ectocarpus sp. 8 AP-2014]